jgi:phage RecT family recombinase
MTAPTEAKSTAVVRIEPGQKGFALQTKIGQILMTRRAHAAIAALVPHGVDYEIVVAEAYRAAVKNPDILKCTPESIIDAVATVVQSGLTIGKTIHLVPNRTKVKGEKNEDGSDKYIDLLQAWNDYKGDVELVLRAGAARAVYAHAVYQNEIAQDRFSVTLGTNPDIVHRPFLDSTKRGALAGAYAVAVMDAHGRVKTVVWLTLADVEKVRANSRSWKPGKVAVCPDWYAIKTAFHALCKVLPKSEATAKILAIQERQQLQDAEEIEAEITDASPATSSAEATTADAPAESYDLRPPTRATDDQKKQIAQLLDSADVTDEERVKIATIAGAKDYGFADAVNLIARLEKLSAPPPSAPADDFEG